MRQSGFALGPQLLAERARWRREGRRLVFTNGCFDLLHAGHLALLEQARALGELLLVAINSDAAVRALKGAGRPLIPEAERAELLLALEPVDQVVIFDDLTPLAAVRALEPEVLVKGADWGPGAIVGSDLVAAQGGAVVRVELLPGRSTTALLQRIRQA